MAASMNCKLQFIAAPLSCIAVLHCWVVLLGGTTMLHNCAALLCSITFLNML